MASTQRPAGRLPTLLFFLFVAIVLVAAGWTPIGNVNHEAGDFAANSLLIQDAKHLQLLYGNYSRVGFNHPGPAILYVLAAGELLFHDVLHVVPSPFSGQLVAACLYNAAWLALAFTLLRRIAGTASALVTLAVAMLVLTFSDFQIFTGIWFPHLYLMPYLVMLIALSRLVYGHLDMLRALAVASGFLINGHVSFVPMLGIMLIVVLAANWRLSAPGGAGAPPRVATRAFLCAHRRDVLIAAGILLLFLLPVLIVSIKDDPGSISQYLKFGRGNKGNKPVAALGFVAVYWGGGIAMVWGMLLTALMVKGTPAAAAARPAYPVPVLRAFGIVLLAATLALLYYAKSGIDDLSHSYIGLFYYAVPALAAGLGTVLVFDSARGAGFAPGRGMALCGAAGLAALAVVAVRAHQPATYTNQYDRPGVAALYERLRTLPGSGRFVLDLERNPQTGGDVWADTLALQAYAARRGVDLLCVNKEWHISNTRAGRCRPEELANPTRHFVVRGTDAIPQAEPDVTGMALALYRVGGTPPPGRFLALKDQKALFAGMLTGGWTGIDGDFVFSIDDVARISLPADPQRGDTLSLDLGAFLPTPGFRQRLQVFVNGQPAGGCEFSQADPRQLVRVALGAAAQGPLDIELRIAHPTSPKELGLNEDTRRLGVSLWGIRIRDKA